MYQEKYSTANYSTPQGSVVSVPDSYPEVVYIQRLGEIIDKINRIEDKVGFISTPTVEKCVGGSVPQPLSSSTKLGVIIDDINNRLDNIIDSIQI